MTTQYAKTIKYNRDTKDYDLLLDDEYVGSARTHHEGEVKLDAIVYNILHGQPITDTCPSCGDVLHDGDRLCAACVPADVIAALPVFRCPTCGGEGDCPDCDPLPAPLPLTQDMYNVICLTLSGAAATTAIAELRRVQARYEKEHWTQGQTAEDVAWQQHMGTYDVPPDYQAMRDFSAALDHMDD